MIICKFTGHESQNNYSISIISPLKNIVFIVRPRQHYQQSVEYFNKSVISRWNLIIPPIIFVCVFVVWKLFGGQSIVRLSLCHISWLSGKENLWVEKQQNKMTNKNDKRIKSDVHEDVLTGLSLFYGTGLLNLYGSLGT